MFHDESSVGKTYLGFPTMSNEAVKKDYYADDTRGKRIDVEVNMLYNNSKRLPDYNYIHGTILIMITGEVLILMLYRLGTHLELFKK